MDAPAEQKVGPWDRLVLVGLWLLIAAGGAASVLVGRAAGVGGAVATVLGAFVVVGAIAGFVGISCLSVLVMTGIATGVFQGIYRGATLHGWAGGVLGVPIGAVAGFFGAILLIATFVAPVVFVASLLDRDKVAEGDKGTGEGAPEVEGGQRTDGG